MHRTTTAATLLASVAVTALSGCVSVERHPAPGPSAESAPPPAPRTDGYSRPRVVEAPAREALELIGPPRAPAPRTTGTAPTVPAAPQRAARPARHSDPPPRRHAHRPEAAEPPALPTAVPTTADLCALGKQYGGWQPGSPEATICQDAYGP
ncbi:hypothetical protein ACFWPU_08135 [Streptomyces sp. NPDC058471]|uniref:hypothetical protein n=1 Tax=Streptomyces sp. NPDC058471 TaxID=3346516 RepID=UPI0036470189